MPKKPADQILEEQISPEAGAGAQSNPEQFIAAITDADADRRQRIALAAYYRAEARGFTAGHELQDWLEAEREVQ